MNTMDDFLARRRQSFDVQTVQLGLYYYNIYVHDCIKYMSYIT